MKNLNIKVIMVFVLLALAGCDKMADTISGGGSESFDQKKEDDMAPPAPEPIPEPEPVVAESSPAAPETDNSKEACLYGMYEFVTEDDMKVHFRAELKPDGIVKYYLTGGPSDTWKLIGNDVHWTQPFPDDNGRIKFTADFVWTIQSKRSDCTVTKFGGTALDRRTPMHARRI